MLRLQQVPQLTQSTQAPLCENSMQIAWVGGGRGEHITGYYINVWLLIKIKGLLGRSFYKNLLWWANVLIRRDPHRFIHLIWKTALWKLQQWGIIDAFI